MFTTNERYGRPLQIASVVLVLLSALAFAQGQSDYHYYYFKQALPLSLDGSSVAISNAEANALQRDAALAAVGIAAERVQPHTLDGWWLADAPQDKQGAQNVEELVKLLARQGAFKIVSPVFIDTHGQPILITGDVMVGFGAEVSRDRAVEILEDAKLGTIINENWASMPGVYRIRCSARDGFEVLKAANALALRSEVVFAEPDMIVTVSHNLIPNDALFPQLWGIHNTGQSGGTSDMDMDGPEAWDVTTGDANILVMVIDTGVQMNHPDLNMGAGKDFTDQGTGGNPGNQCDIHGTAVSGCIASLIHNTIGTAGIAPACRVASARVGIAVVLPSGQCSGYWNGSISWTVAALGWAQEIGARVTNNSNTYPTPSAALDTAYANARNAGIVHFAAAGNGGGSSISYPASISSVNAVAALNRNGGLASFSNWGAGLDFSAPGVSIVTTDRTGNNGYVPGDYVTLDGTSFASPYAAGVAALILSVDSSLTPDAVEQIMRSTTMDLGAGGYDMTFGWGFVNANAAVRSLCVPPGGCANLVYVDSGASGCENGDSGNPFNTVAEGVNQVCSGGVVDIHAGLYPQTLSINRAMTLRATGGMVRIDP